MAMVILHRLRKKNVRKVSGRCIDIGQMSSVNLKSNHSTLLQTFKKPLMDTSNINKKMTLGGKYDCVVDKIMFGNVSQNSKWLLNCRINQNG